MASLYNLSEGYKEVLDKMDEGYSFEDIKPCHEISIMLAS